MSDYKDAKNRQNGVWPAAADTGFYVRWGAKSIYAFEALPFFLAPNLNRLGARDSSVALHTFSFHVFTQLR